MFFMSFLKFLFFSVPPLLCVAFLTLLERKVLSIVGFRLGPWKVSFLGILQPITDAIKLMNKSYNVLSNFSFVFFYLSSVFVMLMSMFIFFILSVFPNALSLKFSILLFFLILGFNSINSIFLGWSTFSKFSLIGSIRTISQLISYEAVLYLCLFFLVLFSCSFDFNSFLYLNVNYFFFILLLCFYIWIPTFLAELNRTPYDFSESESELVSGYNTEFGSSCFTLIFLAEYGNILFFCILGTFIFFSCNYMFFFFFLFLVIWFRSVLPRFRFDKLMYLSWKFFIPFLTVFYILIFMFML